MAGSPYLCMGDASRLARKQAASLRALESPNDALHPAVTGERGR
jgi:hypothetical protein